MKYLSNNLVLLGLAVVLGIAPIQNISASVPDCLDMDTTNSPMNMQNHSMKFIDSKKFVDSKSSSDTSNTSDCCKQDACQAAHCISTTAFGSLSLEPNMTTNYIVSNIYLNPSISLSPFYPSSLYRPPKI